MEPPFSTITEVVGYPSDTLSSKNYPTFDSSLHVPYVVSRIENGTETYYCSVGKCFTYQTALSWTNESSEGKIVKTADYDNYYGCQRIACSEKNKGDLVYIDMTSDYTEIVSFPNDIFMADSGFLGREIESVLRTSVCPLNISGEPKILTSFTTECYVWFGVEKADIGVAKPNMALPKAAKVFVDGGTYLFGKGIYLIFVGTGIVFSTTLDADSFGYLDTTSVLGIISQYGYLDYAKDEQYLYIMGQDSTNKVKIAKLLLNTQFDYATDGAWLPLICGDGLPAYIKAKSEQK